MERWSKDYEEAILKIEHDFYNGFEILMAAKNRSTMKNAKD